ncbi:MAG: DUF808 domain-containing protein [Rickettsiales bacterium]
MSGGLLALLDDIAALVKVTAATLDDIPAQVAKTGAKVSGVVIDDAAVTPKYVVGLDPKRELSIIYNIARRSLFNKLVFLAPGALVLGYAAPWAITPILMLGGAYLCFEGYEKVHGMVHHASDADHDDMSDAATTITPMQLERERIDSAVRTDMILSAEIIAITYGTVVDRDFIGQCIVLFSVAIAITVAVYGFVGLIVKADDIGVYLAKHSRIAAIRAFGRGLVKSMPPFLRVLGVVGTAAMLWVGAEIIAHGVPALHHALEHLHASMADSPVMGWLLKVLACALGGLGIGACVAKVVKFVSAAVLRVKRQPTA